MISYKEHLSENRTDILKSIYNFFEYEKVAEADESENIEFGQPIEDILKESFEFLLDSTEKIDIPIQKRSLIRIANIISSSHEKVLSILTPEDLQIILEHIFQQETCSSAFYALCTITYYTSNFDEIIYDSDLFPFISEKLQEFDENQFYSCIILLINLFVTIPLQKPLEVYLINNLIEFDISKIMETPDIISLYNIILDKEDLPEEFILPIFRTLRKILFQSNKSEVHLLYEQSKKNVFKLFDQLLDDEKYKKKTVSFINNQNIIKPLITEMNESNVIYCLSIILKMSMKDDTFIPHLQAYKFENILIGWCQSKIENIQHVAMACSIAFIKIFPDFAYGFSKFDFEGIFNDATFEIKVSLIELYNRIFSIYIENNVVFTLKFSKIFLSLVLSMLDSDDNVKGDAYYLLYFLFKYKTHFVFDFNVFGEITSEEVVSMIEYDSLSKNTVLSDNASLFLQIINFNNNEI